MLTDRHRLHVLSVISLGGMLGASGRHAVEELWSHAGAAIPWWTLLTNVTGCWLIGVLMVLVVEVGHAHPLLRPFLGVGVLGGYTTFSTYALEVRDLLDADELGLASAYLVGTVVAALLAVALGVAAGRSTVRLHLWLARRKEQDT